MRKLIYLCSAFSLIMQEEALAEWDLSTMQTLGGSCLLTEVRVDDSKLSWSIANFRLSSSDDAPLTHDALAQCEAKVDYILPAHHKPGVLTHRIIADAAKDEFVELKMNVLIETESSQFRFRGVLPFGTKFDDRVLLYKSFDAKEAMGCSDAQQRLSLAFTWSLELLKRDSARIGLISMTGDNSQADAWLSSESCESTRSLTF